MALVQAVTDYIGTSIMKSDCEGLVSHRPTYFHTMKVPGILIQDYLSRLATYMRCSNECFIVALIYIERVHKKEPDFLINSSCIHRLYFTSVVIAAKYLDDVHFKNSYYSKVGGISVAELYILEQQLLSLLNFDLYISEIEYARYAGLLDTTPR